MENKEDKKELDDIIGEINKVAKDLVDEYISGKDKYVPEEERTEINEKQIRTPFKDDKSDVPFKVTDNEMEYLFKVQAKNRLQQKGLLRRFSINCYGKQKIMEEKVISAGYQLKFDHQLHSLNLQTLFLYFFLKSFFF